MPFVYFGSGWLTGIWAASALQLPIAGVLALVFIPIIGWVLWRGNRRAQWIWLSVLFALLGGVRYLLSIPHFDQSSLATYNNRGEVTVEGVIEADPDVRDTYINLRIRADRLTLPDQAARPIEGLLLTRPSRPAEFKYGERVRVTGELVAPPEFATFSYRDYLARQGVYSLIDRPRVVVLGRDQGSPILAAVYAFRDRARTVIAHILPEPQASLLTGILLGDDNGLPQDVQDEFRTTGTTHIIAISGYNITVLISILSAIAVRLIGRRRAFPILVVGLSAYAVLVGGSASVVRATVMGSLALWGIYLGRQAAALNSVFAAGFIMTALDPNALFDVGFQLSFVATLGLIVYAKPFADSTAKLLGRLFGNELARKIVGVINDALLVTLAAQVATLPLLIYYFRQFSIVSLIVNPLVLPAQTGVMGFGLLALGAGLLALPLGQALGWLAWIFLAWTTGIIHLFAALSNASMPLDYVPPIWIIAYYAGLVGLTWYLKQPPERRPKALVQVLTPRRLIVAGGLAAILLGVGLSWQTDGRLHIVALDIEGHPVLVRTPQGQTMLIGGSPSPSSLLGKLGAQLPFWQRDIDWLIVPRVTSGELNGLLGVLDRYDVKQVMALEVTADNRAGSEWRAALTARGLQPLDLRPFEIEPGMAVDFDHAVPVIVSPGGAVAIGACERANISVIADPPDRLPKQPQLLLTWSPDPDPRVVDLTRLGSVDLTIDASTLTLHAGY
jgi:competence protein ComEC